MASAPRDELATTNLLSFNTNQRTASRQIYHHKTVSRNRSPTTQVATNMNIILSPYSSLAMIGDVAMNLIILDRILRGSGA